MEAKLILVGGRATKNEVVLSDLPVVVGRTAQAGLPIAHPLVSRRHCEIYELDGALVVRDLGSANGTHINETPIDEEVLRPGDKLTIGPLTFVAIYQHEGAFPNLHADDEEEFDIFDDEELVEDSGEDLPVFDDFDEGATLEQGQEAGDEIAEVSDVEFLEDDSEIQADFDDSSVLEDDVDGDWEGGSSASGGKSVMELGLDDLTDDSSNMMTDDDDMDDLILEVAEPGQDDYSEGDDEDFSAWEQSGIHREQLGYQDLENAFPVRLILADAGRIRDGSPGRVAGIDVGAVAGLTWAEASGHLLAEALLHLQGSLAQVLREDMQVEVREVREEAVVVITAPGTSEYHLAPDQEVLPVDFPPDLVSHSQDRTPFPSKPAASSEPEPELDLD